MTKLSPDGDILWTEIFDAGADEEGAAIVVDPKGRGVVVAGTTAVFPADGPTERDAVLLFYSTDGDLAWSKVYDFKGRNEFIRALAMSPNGKTIYRRVLWNRICRTRVRQPKCSSSGTRRTTARPSGPSATTPAAREISRRTA